MTDELERLAREATSGPYELEQYGEGWLVNGDGWIVVDYSITDRDERERHAKDAAYFAAASPDVILALLEERRVLREAAARIARYPWGMALAGHNEERDVMPLINALRVALQAEPARAKEGAS